MSFPVTVRTVIDEELTRSQQEVEARRILDVIAIQEETIRRAAEKKKIQEEAVRLSREVISKEAYEFSEKEKVLRAERAHLQWLEPKQTAYCTGRSVDKGVCEGGMRSKARLAEIGKELGVLQEEKRMDIQAEFIILATEREEAKRAEIRSAAEQTLLNIEMAKESERQRMIQEEAEHRELQLQEENIRMAAIAAEQRQAEKVALATVQTFRVEEPQPVSVDVKSTISIFPMLLVGGVALLLLARRK